ncbi:hypothetical protein QBC40DRAFT_249004 [Triangularia verruculosa]|uniref:Uncharacterized protein n=1 Tax=Triangularia verruculosa TaxID=2587418 RepID=A0AAN6XRR6_9PEZI|nr:hypothetical protein QBC40DRAFT_249004 [Triangularia verruculosa]
MAVAKIVLALDSSILTTNSSDTLVLSRKVNNTFSTAFATGSIKPRDASTPQLFSHNVFAWEESFRVLASYNHSSSSALSASLTNAVDIEHGEVAKYDRNMLLPAVKIEDFDSGGEIADAARKSIMFGVTDIPRECKVEVLQSVGSQKCTRIFQSAEIVMQRVIEVEISATFIMFWTGRNLAPGGVVPEQHHRGFEMTFEDDQQVVFVRFGYMVPDQPKAAESPDWYPMGPGSAGFPL